MKWIYKLFVSSTTDILPSEKHCNIFITITPQKCQLSGTSELRWFEKQYFRNDTFSSNVLQRQRYVKPEHNETLDFLIQE